MLHCNNYKYTLQGLFLKYMKKNIYLQSKTIMRFRVVRKRGFIFNQNHKYLCRTLY